MASVLKDAKPIPKQIELITLAGNREICELLQIKAHYIRTANPFLLLLDLIKVPLQVWRIKNARIVDLERTSYLSGIFRLLLSIGKSCSSFTFENSNRSDGKQSFITLKDKAVIQALAEIFQLELKKEQQRARPDYQKNKVVVNVNAGEYLPQRKYPLAYFAELIQQLKQKEDSFTFVLSGSKKEVGYTNGLAELLTKRGIPYENLCGKLSLKELIELLNSSHLLVSNDSGPLHLAHYYNVPTVAIWGPTSAKLVAYADSERMKNISVEKECSPCFIHPKSKVGLACSNRIDCLQELKPNKIVEAVLELSASHQKSVVHVN